MSKRLKPIGNIPRLLGAWVCTEAVRTQSRERGGGGGGGRESFSVQNAVRNFRNHPRPATCVIRSDR